MLSIFFQILSYWLLLGMVMFLIMFLCLQFANLCEHIVDFVVTKK